MVKIKRELVLVCFFILIFILLLLPVFSTSENSVSCLSLTFDDGLKSHYDVVYPRLLEKEFGATFFVVTDLEKDPLGRDLLTFSQIQELIKEGFEIGSHTSSHPFLTKLSEEEIENELQQSKENLEKEYDILVTSLAFPYGDSNQKVVEIAQKYYLNARAIYNRKPVGFVIDSFGLKSDTDVSDICKYVQYAKERDLWLVLVLHDISENPGTWDTSISDFEEILDCAKNNQIIVDSLSGCRSKIL